MKTPMQVKNVLDSHAAGRAVVLLSGGQDSTTALLWAMQAGFTEIKAVAFHYGQAHAIELESASKIADMLSIPLVKIRLGLLGGSALTKTLPGKTVNDHHPRAYYGDELPASFVPGRNLILLSYAAAEYARVYPAEDIQLITGFCQTDYSGYPDCRLDFVHAAQEAIGKALGRTCRIYTPIMHLTKAETFALAYKLGFLDLVIEHTMTDYNGSLDRNPWGRGRTDNPASLLRAKGFTEAIDKSFIPRTAGTFMVESTTT